MTLRYVLTFPPGVELMPKELEAVSDAFRAALKNPGIEAVVFAHGGTVTKLPPDPPNTKAHAAWVRRQIAWRVR